MFLIFVPLYAQHFTAKKLHPKWQGWLISSYFMEQFQEGDYLIGYTVRAVMLLIGGH